MNQINGDNKFMDYVREQNRNSKPEGKRLIHSHSVSQNKQNRCSSAISRLNSKYLLSNGYNDIMSKVSEEENERKKKLIRKRKRKKQKLNKGITFSTKNSSMNEYVFKKRIADDISQMIISNLQNYQSQGPTQHSTNSLFQYSNQSKAKNSIFDRSRPDLGRYRPLRRKGTFIFLT